MSSKAEKLIYKKTNNLCAHCGKPSILTIDHIIPQTLGGGNDPRNLIPLCKKCNRSRASGEVELEGYYKYASSWAIEDAREYIESWKREHTNATGELLVTRFGIKEGK